MHDIRFVEDNWESPTLGAWGLGWEVWLNGMEVTQFTYFQQVGGLDCRPVTGEITYGLERIAMYLQGVDSVFDLIWTDGRSAASPTATSSTRTKWRCRATTSSTPTPSVLFALRRRRARLQRLIEQKLTLPAYEQVLEASHTFNLLDARQAISVTERQRYILRVRELARRSRRRYYDEPRGARLSDGQRRASGA